jgi:Family of unknown function (DUF6159)
MERWSDGWRLGLASWRLVLRDRRLLIFPAISMLSLVGAAAIVFGLGGGPSELGAGSWKLGMFLCGVVLGYPLTLISTFFGVAFVSQATARLDGREPSVRAGLSVAWSRRAAIAWWALLAAGVASLLDGISKLPGGGWAENILAWVASAAWSAATFFVIPVLALEDRGVGDSLKRSAEIFRSRWREEISGGAVTGVLGLLLLIPGLVVGLLGGGLWAAGDHGAAVVVLSIAGVLAAIGVAIGSATDQLFGVVLYRHATGASVPADFPDADLNDPFHAGTRWSNRS